MKKLIFGTVASLMLSFIAQPTQAFTIHGCKFSGNNPTIYVKTDLATPEWEVATAAAMNRWNSVSVPGQFLSWVNYAANKIYITETSYADEGIFGDTLLDCTNGIWTQNRVFVRFSSEAGATFGSSALRKIAVHELGHSLGLNHMPSTSCNVIPSVMTQGSLKWSCGWGLEPWQDDINGINYIY